MDKPQISPEQLRYSTLLYWGSRSGLAISIGAFLAYVFGILPAHVPLDQLPHAWHLPVSEYLAETAAPTGWGWVALLGQGDFASLGGIAWLSSCSIVCLLGIIPVYRARNERLFVAICVIQSTILLFAASGILSYVE